MVVCCSGKAVVVILISAAKTAFTVHPYPSCAVLGDVWEYVEVCDEGSFVVWYVLVGSTW